MAAKKPKIVHAVGKRKIAVARATLRPGKGRVRINSTPLELWATRYYRMKVMEPLILAGDKYASQVDIDVNVSSGGLSSQADAARTAIARALVEFYGEKLKELFLAYDRTLLVPDMRQNEPWKPGPSKPRAAAQKSKR